METILLILLFSFSLFILLKERNKRISKISEKLKKFKSNFKMKNDTNWKRWVDFDIRNQTDLIRLINEDVNLELKKRAIFILFLPYLEWKVIYWNYDLVIDYLPDKDFIKGSDSKLLNFAIELLITLGKDLKLLKKHLKQNPSITHFSSADLSIFHSYDEELKNCNDIIKIYQKYVINLLQLLDKTKYPNEFNDLLNIFQLYCDENNIIITNQKYQKRREEEKLLTSMS